MSSSSASPFRHRLFGRLTRTLVAGVFAVPLVLAGTAGSAAADKPAIEPGQAYMGVGIEQHEGLPEGGLRALAPSGPQGIDVSHWQGTINWSAVRSSGIRFAYMKATEGTYYTDDTFDRNYIRSYENGIIRGAYHFARPDRDALAQARFFVKNGGGWSADGRTLPPVLDIEYNPYGSVCYGQNHTGMVRWVRTFSNEVERLTGRYPVIYTTTDWWRRCTGDSGAFNTTNPLWIARWASSPDPLPNWPFYTIWQYTATGRVSGVSGDVDRNVFNGSMSRLEAFAKCSHSNPC
ncbi:lysozyme [Amycolatopsis aidingensis]|uniref:lysozyme n=1 Tax=Amycolatopsis aidingensis TaxID=2842453 RepID=UPI001C0C1ED0|nr:lysozyme [Amycolatopsis aidingensis]